MTIDRTTFLSAVLALGVLATAPAARAATASAPAVAGHAGTQDAALAKAKLAVVRGRIADLTGRLGAELKERDAIGARLREAELGITAKRRRLESIDAAEQVAERKRAELRVARTRVRGELDAQRAALAEQVRAEYLLGSSDELRLLLSQTDPARVGRTLAYYGYFARRRADRIAAIGVQETHLQELLAQIDRETEELDSLRGEASREMAGLEQARQERAAALTAASEQLQSGHDELSRLHKQEQAVEGLLADLARVLKEYPLDPLRRPVEPRGTLPWPVAGKMTVRHLETRTNGARTAVHPAGVLIETARGAKVRVPLPGRVVYSDWLQGMGMLLIVAHAGGCLTLYGHAEVLFKSVGDSVAAGEVVAGMSDAAGAAPQLYFEIRQGTKPVDPRDWLRRTPDQ